MEAILPYDTLNREIFLESAERLGFHQTIAYKFLYVMQDNDMDVYPLMGEERINILLYAWQLCERYRLNDNNRDWEPLRTMLKIIVPLSLNAWFSEEWKFCHPFFRNLLLYCIRRAKDLLSLCYVSIDWDYWLNLGPTPYDIEYLKNLKPVTPNIYDRTVCIENVVDTVNVDDMEYVMQEHYFLIALRLIKLFDCRSLGVVQTLSMRVIAGWNELYLQNISVTSMNEKNCLIFICHMYLLAAYEMDDITGFVLDNLVNNIRFYYENFASKSFIINNSVNMEYTPARLIAITCIRLGLYRNEFFENFIWNSYDAYVVTLFGVVSQAYKSYLLGNLLMELNLMNEKDFALHFDYYKRLMTQYIFERESSELFILNEIRKKNAQHCAYNVVKTIKFMTDLESKICKGNRLSNICNYDYECDDQKTEINIFRKDDNDKVTKVDPVFENLPNNEIVLNYVYESLTSRSYKGWQFAKIVTLTKLIGLELSSIEKWRYHPGLTTEFMLNLEVKLSQHYEDFAKMFEEYWFIEQEFCLTAFYLNPNQKLYDYVIRCGIRFNKRRLDDSSKQILHEKTCIAKFGLLSSSIDVKEIVNLTNSEALHLDYEPLCSALHTLCLPDNIIKDILTVVFLPRNKSFAWVVNWNELRKRCKTLLRNVNEKKRFVELNMAEANDRLKFLKIDYEKYKNRPQLDYGTIEEGYECHINVADYKSNADNYEELDYDDFEDEEDDYTLQKNNSGADQNSFEEESFKYFDDDEENSFTKRRTRSCTAALANAALANAECIAGIKTDNEMKSNTLDSVSEKLMDNSETSKQDFKNCITKGPKFVNSTPGFHAFPDIWNVSINDIQLIDHSPIHLIENSSSIKRFIYLHKYHVMRTDEQIYSAQENEDFKCDEKGTTITTKNEIVVRMANLLNNIINSAQIDNGSENNESRKFDYTNTYQLNDNGINEKNGKDIGTTILQIENENNFPDIQAHSGENGIKQTCIKNVSTNLTHEEEQTKHIPKNEFDEHDSKDMRVYVSKLHQIVNERKIDDEKLSETESSLEQKRLEEFKTACMRNMLQVRIPRLTVKDVGNLRQPVVLLNPINGNVYAKNKRKRSKRLDYAESSDDSYEVCKYEERRFRRSSDSSIDSLLIGSKRSKYKKRKKHTSKAHNYRISNAKRRTNLIVTPRSKNGLKLRITNADPGKTTLGQSTVIETLLLSPTLIINDLSDTKIFISTVTDINNALNEGDIIT